MKKILLIALLILLFTTPIYSAEVTLQWDPQPDAKGFNVYRSLDMGQIWKLHKTISGDNKITLQGEPDTGIVLYRFGAFNDMGEQIRLNAGCFLWSDAPKPPDKPQGIGIE